MFSRALDSNKGEQDAHTKTTGIGVGRRTAMVTIRRADGRGRTNWALTRQSPQLSFGDYYDPSNMG